MNPRERMDSTSHRAKPASSLTIRRVFIHRWVGGGVGGWVGDVPLNPRERMDSTSHRANPASSFTIRRVSASVMRTSPQYLGEVSTSLKRLSTCLFG